MLGRARREERRDERRTFGAGGVATRYRMKERLLPVGDDSWIEDGSGSQPFKVDGRLLRLRTTVVLEDQHGHEPFTIQARVARVRDVMDIEGVDGHTVATVEKAMVTPLRERFIVDVAGGAQKSAPGNVVDHELDIEANGAKVAEVSEKWFRIRESHGIGVAPGQNDALVRAAVCIDEMSGD